MGAATAWQLARRGHRVLVLEQHDLGHARGSSHGPARIFRLVYDEADYVRLGMDAIPLWREAEQEMETELLWTTGGLEVGSSCDLEPVARSLRAVDVPFERLSAAEARRRFPAFAVEDGMEALYQPDMGVLYADRCRNGLLTLAQRHGAEITPHARVERIEVEGDRARLHINNEVLPVEQVVLAAGGWSNRLLEPLGLGIPLTVTREQVAYYRVLPDRQLLPFIWHEPDGTVWYGLPNADQGRGKVGQHGGGPEVDPDSEAGLHEERLGQLHRFVAERLACLDPTSLGAETCLYATTPDDNFVIDRAGPVVIGAGFGGHGYKFASITGSLLADAVEGKPNPYVARFGRARLLPEALGALERRAGR
jgi:sarcosine oxidase